MNIEGPTIKAVRKNQPGADPPPLEVRFTKQYQNLCEAERRLHHKECAVATKAEVALAHQCERDGG